MELTNDILEKSFGLFKDRSPNSPTKSPSTHTWRIIELDKARKVYLNHLDKSIPDDADYKDIIAHMYDCWSSAVFFYYRKNVSATLRGGEFDKYKYLLTTSSKLVDGGVKPHEFALWRVSWFYARKIDAPRINTVFSHNFVTEHTISLFKNTWREPYGSYIIHPVDKRILEEQFYRNVEAGMDVVNWAKFPSWYVKKRESEISLDFTDPMCQYPKLN